MLVSPPAQRSLGQGKRTAATSATTSRKSGDVPRTSDTSGYDKMADVLCSESDRKQFAASVINESALSAGEKSGKCANLALPNRMQSATGVMKRAETVKTRVNREQQNMTATGQQQQQQQKQQQSKKVSDSKMSKNKSASIMALSSQGPGPVGSHVGAGMCPVVLAASAGPVVGSGIGTSGSGGGGVGIANATAGKSNNASRVSIEMKKTLPSKVKNVSLQASIAAVTGVTTTKIPIPKSHQKKDLKSVSAATHLDMAGVNSVLEPGQKQEQQQQQQQQDIDDGPSAKKKRCSDRYDSSESSDSGVATLSCTDSSTASSDASDPGSPYSPVSLGEDANQSSTKANMPPQILSSITQQDHRVQTHQSHQQTSTSNHQTAQHQQPPKQHQWPWNVSSNNNNTLSTRFNNTCSSNNIIANAGVKCNTNSSVNSVLSGNGNANTKSKRISSANHSDINGTAKKARSSAGIVDRMQTHAGLTAGVSKRLKVQQEESPAQKKITGYFKSQMKPLKVPTKSDLNTLVSKTTSTDAQSATAALDKYFNALAAKTVTSSMPVGTKEVKDQTQRKLIAIKKDFVDLPPLAQTKSMPPSLKKFERKPAQVAQVAPNPRKSSATAQVKSPKKHVAIAPRTAEPIKPQAQIPLSTTAFQIDQTKISQPTVLLTAIRIPPQSNAQVQQQMSTSSSLPQQTNVKAPPLTPTKLGPMLQIPVVPNLVQIPNLLATTNGTNLVMNNGQLTRVGNGGQYFLNGTVLKLQQFSNGHPANSNNGNGVLTMDSSSLQGNILVKQSPTISPSMPIIATSTQAKGTALSSQQPIVAQAPINGNGCHPAYLANQRIPTQSVLMATSSGWYVLNQSTTDVISNNIAHQTTLATAMMCKPTRAAVTSITNNVSLPVPPLATLSSKVDTTPTLGPKNLGASTITTSTTIPAEQKTKTLISDAEPIEPDKPLTVECPPLEPLKEISIPPLTSNGILESLKNKFFPPKSPSCPAIFTTEDLGEKDTRAPVATTKCAISPILSQPKTIRFPVPSGCEAGYRFGPKGTKRPDGVCYWDKCIEKYDTNSKLLDHLQTQHVNSQTGPFSCLWSGCKVRGRESCSRRWLERHVLSHGGTKPFKCIVDGCGLRLGSQLALQKHVNGHFNATESKDNQNKRASDPPVPKLLRKNGKKLRYRRQPFSARMFDFFDAGIMEGLQHRLLVTGSLVNSSKGSIAFTGRSMARRKTSSGITELYVKWSPSEIIPDEWIPESKNALSKIVTIQSMPYHERLALNKYLKSTSQNVDVNGKTVPKQQFPASAATTAVSSLFNCSSSSIVDSKPAAAAVSNGRKHSRKPPKKNDIEPS